MPESWSTMFDFGLPGGLAGETEITCPHCQASQKVSVNDPCGVESYQCRECDLGFSVNWDHGTP